MSERTNYEIVYGYSVHQESVIDIVRTVGIKPPLENPGLIKAIGELSNASLAQLPDCTEISFADSRKYDDQPISPSGAELRETVAGILRDAGHEVSIIKRVVQLRGNVTSIFEQLDEMRKRNLHV